jgi:hypothetical protein
MTPLLVDLDLDFFFNDPADWTQSPEKDLWRGGNHALDYVASLPTKERVLVIDHHEVLRHWDLRGYKKALCLHIDAHHDAFAKDANAWRRPLGSRGVMVGVGDFIFQALRENIINQLVWWKPPVEVTSESADSLQRILGPRLGRRVGVLTWPSIPQITGEVDLLSVSISPEWLNPNCTEWIRFALQLLGFDTTAIDQALIGAKARWSVAHEHAEHMMPFRYRFPENYR